MKIVGVRIDTLEDFMTMSNKYKGKLYVEGSEDIKPKTQELTDLYRANNIQQVFFADHHTPESEELSKNPDFVNTFPEHAIEGTFGSQFISESKPNNPYVVHWHNSDYDINKAKESMELILTKDKFNAFTGSPHTESVLETISADTYIVDGVAGNVCVDYFVMEALDRGAQVYVVMDAVKELPTIPFEPTVDKWKEAGAYLINTKDVKHMLTEQYTR